MVAGFSAVVYGCGLSGDFGLLRHDAILVAGIWVSMFRASARKNERKREEERKATKADLGVAAIRDGCRK